MFDKDSLADITDWRLWIRSQYKRDFIHLQSELWAIYSVLPKGCHKHSIKSNIETYVTIAQ
jgi:hypothetical protein